MDFDDESSIFPPQEPVTCLGLTFENDEARRVHFTEELRKKLQPHGVHIRTIHGLGYLLESSSGETLEQEPPADA